MRYWATVKTIQKASRLDLFPGEQNSKKRKSVYYKIDCTVGYVRRSPKYFRYSVQRTDTLLRSRFTKSMRQKNQPPLLTPVRRGDHRTDVLAGSELKVTIEPALPLMPLDTLDANKE